jgi:hypothetical protein
MLAKLSGQRYIPTEQKEAFSQLWQLAEDHRTKINDILELVDATASTTQIIDMIKPLAREAFVYKLPVVYNDEQKSLSARISAIDNGWGLATKEPTGVVDKTKSSIAFSDALLRFTITGINFEIFINGSKLIKNTESVDITNTVGLWYIYYNSSGVLTASQTVWSFESTVSLASIYWNGTNGLLCEERHGVTMDWRTHEYLHETVGARYVSGYVATITNAETWSLSQGHFHDEDLGHDSGGAKTTARVFYKTASGYTFTAAQAAMYFDAADIIQYNNGTALADVDNNKYTCSWIFSSPDPTNPIWIIIGQNNDTLLATARTRTYDTLSLGTLPSPEMKLLYRVILQRSGTGVDYIETADYRSVSNLPSGTYTATAHSGLSGLLNDDHTQYVLADGTRAMAKIVAGNIAKTASSLAELNALIALDVNMSIIIVGNISGSGSLSIPSKIDIIGFLNSVIFTGFDDVTIGRMTYDGLVQITDCPLIFGAVKWVRPEWFGSATGSLVRAIESLPTSGGAIKLINSDYDICGEYSVSATPGAAIGNEKKNVKLLGSGMPIKSSDGTRFVSGSGTVIQGMFLNFADGFEAYDLGVDCGDYVVANLNGGNHIDGFVAGTHKLDHDAADYEYYIRDVHVGNIKVLLKDPVAATPSTYFHAFLFEHIIGGSHGYIECDGGYHGYVIKSIDVKGGDVRTYNQLYGTTYIFKSDQYTFCRNVTVDSITVGKKINESITTVTGIVESVTDYDTQGITIGILHGVNCNTLLQRYGTGKVYDVNIGNVICENITGNCIVIDENMERVNIGNHLINGSTGYGIYTVDGCLDVNIGNGSAYNCAYSGYFLGGDVRHGEISCIGNGAYGIELGSGAQIDTSHVRGRDNGTSLLSGILALLVAADLENSWVEEGGSEHPFQVTYSGNTLQIRGMVKDGTTATVATLPVGYRPGYNLTFVAYAIKADDTTKTFAHITIGTDGAIQVSNLSDLGGTGAHIGFGITYLI